MLSMQQKQCSPQKKNISIKCLNKEILKTLNLTTSNNLLEKDLMKNYLSLVTSTSGNTLVIMKKHQTNLTGFTILQAGILTPTFLLLGLLIILKLTKAKILKIYGKEYN